MKEGKFSDSKVILRNWRDKGYLNHEKDRLTRSRKLGKTGIVNNVYVIRFEQAHEADETPSIHTLLREVKIING